MVCEIVRYFNILYRFLQCQAVYTKQLFRVNLVEMNGRRSILA